jgi:hypothetical protein
MSKEFWLTKEGEISKHKIRGANIIAHGILHPDQYLKIYTKSYYHNPDKVYTLVYEEIKVGTHQAKTALLLPSEYIYKVDIITKDTNNYCPIQHDLKP